MPATTKKDRGRPKISIPNEFGSLPAPPLSPSCRQKEGKWSTPNTVTQSSLQPTLLEIHTSLQPTLLRAVEWFYGRPAKPRAAAFTETTLELHDIVKIACEAHRAGAGDLLWMSWMEASSRKKGAPSRFSGLIAISAIGARKLLANFEEWIPMGFFDCNLRKALGGNRECRAKLAAGYLYPS